MVSAVEGAGAKQGIAANLAEGVNTLSLNDTVTFTQYVRLVLPLDGMVFWVKADLVQPSALFNAMGFNRSTFGKGQKIEKPASTLTIKGSLHYSTKQDQNEAETEGVSSVVFTALEPIQEFNDVQPNTMWIGTYAGDREGDDGPITFAFSQRGKYYKQADLFHYMGTAVLPVFKTQLISTITALAQRELIISNSLPIWLSLNGYSPPYIGFSNPITLYPSYLLPDNLPPPYGAVHIEPNQTEAIQSTPAFNATLSQSQLARDMVRVTLYGLTNEAALRFLACVEQFCFDYGTIGLMNMPVVRDEKRLQQELNVIAMKKTIDFEVSYNQQAVRNIAVALIKKAIINYEPGLP
jgi:hypothetical protein